MGSFLFLMILYWHGASAFCLFHPPLLLSRPVGLLSTLRIRSRSEVHSSSTGGTNGEEETSKKSSSSVPFTIETTRDGPAGGPVHRLTFFHTDVAPVIIETGKIGRQAAGAVRVTRGETVLYSTAARDADPKEEIDFMPLSVEHQERFSSVGTTSGSYNRRDGRAAEHEILTCRLIDRPIRPLIVAGWRHETQLLNWVLSYDGVRSTDALSIISCAAALYLSDVPFVKPVAAVQVGVTAQGEFMLNPSNEQMEQSRLNLIVAGTVDAVLMIEGSADFLPEEVFLGAIQFGHAAIQVFCQGLKAFGEVAGVPKNFSTLKSAPKGLQDKLDELFSDRVDDMYGNGGNKRAQGAIMTSLYKAVVEELEVFYPGEKVAIKIAFKDLLCRRLFEHAKATGKRGDGRGLDEIRHIYIETGFLPRVHGSALFTRGETQALATATLGDSSMRQKIDKINGLESKRFYLQYAFPPSSVGETGRVGAPGRREVGHGNLAERALLRILPSEEEFPYTIRVESLITESHGSSSMASVCGGALALMDAGVPVKNPVAGIAMGMLLGDKDGVSDENALILSDITGTEDALGTMDFKVAGNREGITTFQLDIKCEGLTIETMARALEQARVGRLHILDEMDKVLAKPRETLPATVPKVATFQVPFDSIGKIIGPGGKQIRSIIEDFGLVNVDVTDEGRVQVSSFDEDKMKEAQEFVLALVASGGGGSGRGKREERPKYAGPEPEEGATYTGKIVGVHPFGVFVEILPGAEDGSSPGLEGLVHVSELARERVRNCEAFVRSMNVEKLTVKYLGVEKGKIRLSRKILLDEQYGVLSTSSSDNRAGVSNDTNGQIPAAMSQEEIDVIAEAIQGIEKI
jgi:polyribonucleotide nucleotidyltransferase